MSPLSIRFRRVLLWGGGVLVVLLAVVLVALQSEPARAYVLETITNRLDETLAGEVSVERVSGTLLWGATLHEVTVDDARGHRVLQAEAVRVNYSLPRLLGGDVDFNGLAFERPILELHRYEDGTLNVSQVLAARKQPAEPTAPTERVFGLRRLDVSDGTVIYTDETPKGRAAKERAATDIDASGRLQVFGGGRVAVEASELAFTTDAGALRRPVGVDAEDVRLQVEPPEIALGAGRIDIGEESRVDDLELAYARGQEGRPSTIDGQFDEAVLTPRLVRALVPSVHLAGRITAEASFQGPPSKLAVDGRLRSAKGGNLRFEGTVAPGAPQAALTIQAEDFAPNHWIAMADSGIEFDARGKVVASRRGSATRLQLQMTATDLRAGDFRADRVVLGDAKDLDVRFAEAKGRSQVSVVGPISASAVQAKGAEIGGVAAQIDMRRVGATNTGTVRADIDRLTAGEHTYGSGRVKLDLKTADRFALDLRAVPDIAPQFPVSAFAAGSHTEDFDRLVLSTLRIGRPGLVWKTRGPSTVRISEQTVSLDSMVLYGPGTSVRLDGTYPRDRFLASLIERLGLAGVEGLLQNDQIQQQLPEELRKQLPDELEKQLPDELEEQLPEELKKRLPGLLN